MARTAASDSAKQVKWDFCNKFVTVFADKRTATEYQHYGFEVIFRTYCVLKVLRN